MRPPRGARPGHQRDAVRDLAYERAARYRALLIEVRDFIDHRPHHSQPLDPNTPCCDLERRIDEALGES